MGLIIALIILGLLLLFAEILLIPGIGIAGVLGVVSMGGACYYAFSEHGMTYGLIVTAIVCVLLVAMLIWVLRAKTWQKMSLDTNITSKAVVQDVEVKQGDTGLALTRLAPMGNVRFGNHVLEVTSLSGIIDKGTPVEVALLDDSKIYVKKINQ